MKFMFHHPTETYILILYSLMKEDHINKKHEWNEKSHFVSICLAYLLSRIKKHFPRLLTAPSEHPKFLGKLVQ